MATTLFSQRQRGRLSSLGRSIVAATLLHEREFRQSGGLCGQSGGLCGRIVAATLLRERSFRRLGCPTLFSEREFR